jgi:CheY-like chemotaxis protein
MQAKIVVAEKSKTVRRMVDISLEKHPFELVFAADGQAALDAMRSSQPVLAIIDAALPGIDGYEVARKLKADPATQATKVLLLVGRNSRFDNARARQAGIDGHLPKPFLSQKLIESVFEALGEAVPDKGLFRSTTLNIPLAHKPAAPEPELAPPPAAEVRPTPAGRAHPPLPRPPAAPPAQAAPPAPREPSAPPADVFEAPTPAVPPPSVIQAAVEATTAAVASTGNSLDGASREVIEQIAWEVIPQLAEAILKEEIAKLVRQRLSA